MEKQTIFIKGMVCNRCIMTVKTELESLGHQSVHVSLGEVSFIETEESNEEDKLERRLSLLGFRLLEDKKVKLVNEVKTAIKEIYSGDFDFPDYFRFSLFIMKRLGKSYDTISDAFIAVEKKAIEQFIIEFRISKVKELLVYTDITLSDIAFNLNFTSAAHLSSQFKQQTGLTPSHFKAIKREKAEAVYSKN